MTERAVERLVIVGANHRSSTLTLRDALHIEDTELPLALAAVRRLGIGEGLLLATCDRVEVVAVADDGARAEDRALAFLAEWAGTSADALKGQVYRLTGLEAVRHLFAVTASLDSLVIGEPHVLGQVKAAHRACREASLSGPDLEATLQAAYAVAKRVRTETAIAEGPVSVAAAAVQTARDLFGNLAECRLLVAGGVDMGELVADSLLAAGVKDIRITARRPAQAETLATHFGAHTVPFDQFAASLADAEVVIAAIGGRTWAVTEEAVKTALRQRRRKPILFIDCGIPGDIEPTVDRIDSAFLYDLNDLEAVAEQGRSSREQAARAAWAIVTEGVEGFAEASAERTAVPAIAALHRHFEAERARALADAGDDAGKATRLLLSRLLHEPSETLRQMAAKGDAAEWAAAEALLRRLFTLDRE